MHIGHYLYSASDEAIIKDRPLQQLSRVISACPDSIFSMQKCVVNVLEKKKKEGRKEHARERKAIFNRVEISAHLRRVHIRDR